MTLTRKECSNIVESLAKLHEGFPDVLSFDLRTLLDACHSTAEKSVYRFALARAEKAADKVDVLRRQADQYRAKAARLTPCEETRWLEEQAAGNDVRIERIKRTLATTLLDLRYR